MDKARALNRIAESLSLLAAPSPEEKVFLAVYRLEAVARENGFDEYFTTPAGDQANEVVAALRTIGANGAAQIVSEALQLVYGPSIPEDHETRTAIWRAMSPEDYETLGLHDDAYWTYPDNLVDLLFNYVVAQSKAIRGAEGVFDAEAPPSLLDRIAGIFRN